jgi:hypothetical protein
MAEPYTLPDLADGCLLPSSTTIRTTSPTVVGRCCCWTCGSTPTTCAYRTGKADYVAAFYT